MKVLLVINSLATGGAEKLLLDTIPRYVDAGITMELLLLNGKDTPFLEKLKEKSAIPIYSLSSGSVYNPMLIYKLRKYLKEYDIVHVHLFPSLYWIALCKWIFSIKTKIIFTEHSTSNRRRNTFFTVFDRFIYRQYNLIIAISENVKENLNSHIKNHKIKIIVIENGVDVEKIKKALPLNNFKAKGQKDIKYVIQVSRFQYPKDQNTVIRAFSHLPEDIELLLVGSGKGLKASKKLARELNLEEKIHFLGIRTDVPNLLKTAAIVILSSHYEGMSLSSIEGMASGRPFIASDVPGLTSIVKGAGILFPLGDEKKLASHILDLLNDETLYADIVLKCQERAAKYSIENMVENHIKLYKCLKEN